MCLFLLETLLLKIMVGYLSSSQYKPFWPPLESSRLDVLIRDKANKWEDDFVANVGKLLQSAVLATAKLQRYIRAISSPIVETNQRTLTFTST